MLVCSWREYEHVHSLSHPCDDGHACQRSSSGFLPSRSDFPGVTIYTNFNKNAHKGTIEIDTLGKLQFLYWQFEVINKNEKKISSETYNYLYMSENMTCFLHVEVLSCCKVWIYQVAVYTKENFVLTHVLPPGKFKILEFTNFVFTGLIYKFCIYRVAVLNTINFVLTAIR